MILLYLLFDDHLSVPHDEATEKQEAAPQVDLKVGQGFCRLVPTLFVQLKESSLK